MIGNIQSTLTPREQWRKKYPSIITGIFSFLQFLLTIVIIGCEVGSILIDTIVATIYVGLWASLFFIIAWISQATAACCCRNRACATYSLIIQIISMFFASCVIGFDAYYIANPSTCFFPTSTCTSTGSARGLFYSAANFNDIKMPLIKAQLAAGAVIKGSAAVQPLKQNPYPTLPTVSNGILTAPPVNSYGQLMITAKDDNRATLVVCPTCSTAMNMTVSKRPPI